MDKNPTAPPEGNARVFGFLPGRGGISWFHRNPRLSNRHCLYCSQVVGEGSEVDSDREHLIARNFVPPGSFSDPLAFNFLFRACVRCNAEKSQLEDHVAAVTMLYSPGRAEMPTVDETAQRKGANSYDPRYPGQPVGTLQHRSEIKAGGIFTFGFVAGPQLDPNKVNLLAFRQIQGFFALVTSLNPQTTEGTRLLPADQFGLHGVYPHSDWGNQHLDEIARRARSLPSVAEIRTAEGYFKCSLRQPAPNLPWFWALEWNKSFRLVGWIGERQTPPQLFEGLPSLKWRDRGTQNGKRARTRREISLESQEDILFDPEGGGIT